MKVAFLILHYNEIELTKKAVDSILKMDSFGENDREIVIVDNCSPNGSGRAIVDYYANASDGPKDILKETSKAEENANGNTEDNSEALERYTYVINGAGDNPVKLHIILNTENGGFSKGNNIGYYYIKKNCGTDFVVALNNDITFPQKNFISILVDIYNREESKFYLAGPDVYTPHIRSHISPLFDKPRGLQETDEKLRILDDIIRDFEGGISFSKYFRYLQEKYQGSWLLGLYNKIRSKEYSGATPYDKPAYNCVLNGACIIVDRRYIEENDILFEEKTFLYAEEDFITLRLSKKNQMIRYCPELVTDHVGQGSSGFGWMNYKAYCKKNADTTRRIREAFEIYRKNL